jgi:hypothetical protein
MKNRNIQLTAMLFVVALAVVPIAPAAQQPGGIPSAAEPLITIHSTDNVKRGQTGAFVLNMKPGQFLGGMYVNFSVSGTAIQGADYVAPVSPAYISRSGYAVIKIRTLPDLRESPSHEAYSVVITLVDGAGYTVGDEASSATMWIKP